MKQRKALFPMTAKALGARQVETVISTGSTDREGDTIAVDGWDLAAYRKNPVILWSHNPHEPPIARSIEIGVVGGVLRSVDEFPPEGTYPLADVVHNLVKSGFIGAKSVGFRPVRWAFNDKNGVDYFEQELLEHSYVSIPANAEALVTAKSKGCDRGALDRWLGRADDEPVLVLRDTGEAPGGR